MNMKKLFSIFMCVISIAFCVMSTFCVKDIILLVTCWGLGVVSFLAHIDLLMYNYKK